MGNFQTQKIKKLSKLMTGKNGAREKQGKRLNGRLYKERLRLSAIKSKPSGQKMLVRREEQCQEGDEANCNKEVDKKVVESSILCSEDQRVDFNLTQEECNVASENECSQSSSACGGNGQAGNRTQLMDEYAFDTESVKSQSEIEKESHCAICMLGGKLLCCRGQGCRKSFHVSCVDPPLTFTPPGIWHCSRCTRKKIEFGVHSVSEGIESILDYRKVLSDDKEMHKQKEYLVKYKSLAHVHNRWIPEAQLRIEAPMVLEREKWKKNRGKAEWSVPHRLIKRRLLISPGSCNGNDVEDSDCDYEWLVKWRGLNYDHSTWELANASFLKTPEAMILVKNFESRKQNANPTTDPSMKEEEMKITPVQLSEFPFETSPGLHDCQLTYVNKLRGYWSRGQNAVVFDEERIEKAVLFILSLQCEACQPVLIITSCNNISLWESEFSRCSLSADVVIYNGNSDVRAIIRTLEFYNEGGSVSFQVLLSTPDAIVEDLEMLDHIKWEVMVIDECQRPVISVHLVQLQILAADMKLLLFSGEVLDRKINYHNVLSLIDSTFEETNEDMASDSNIGTHKLKEKLADFIAYECKFDTHVFSEYWVPVRLSSMQIEQYRDLLLSNSRVLCSSSKNDASDPLRDILSLTQKCCDHPYLVDHTLRSCVIRDLPFDDHLNAEINVSGKLQLLDMILSEVKKRGFKVLVLFQKSFQMPQPTTGKISISIGDILDDLVHKKFGEDYYTRIEGGMAHSRRQAALDMFNNKESTSFVCLMDYRACVPSVKLTSLDIVILFNSDLNPSNDLRSLQKITINPQLEQIKIFRLYSCFTIEEKSLILAKQGIVFDCKPKNINQRTCHMLLTWGASFLCNKSNDYNTHISSGESFLADVFSELLAKLSNIVEDASAGKGSIILKLEPTEGNYSSNIMLLGEVENPSADPVDREEPHLFWRNVLKERHHPKLKHLYMPPRRVHTKSQMYDAWPEGFESEKSEIEHQKSVNSTISKMGTKNKRKIISDTEGSKLTGASGRSTGKRSKLLRTPRMMQQETISMQESLSQSHQNLPSHENPTFMDQVREQPPLEDSTNLFAVTPPSQPLEDTSHPRNTNAGSESQNGLPSLFVTPELTQSAGTSHPRNTNAGSESQNGLPSLFVTPELTQSAGMDPLQREMERIQKDKDEAIKTCQEKQWRLNLEREKELAVVHKKYDALIQESGMGLVKQVEILDRNYKIVYVSKLLAEALAKKCDTSEVAFCNATQEETMARFADDILQFYDHSTLKSSQMADLPMGPTMQDVNFPPCPPPVISPVETRFLTIPTINTFVNSLPGSGFRAPAPHLRNSGTFSYAPLPSIPEPPLTRFTLTQSANVGTSSMVNFPTADLADDIYRLLPLDVDFSTLFSMENPGSNYRAI